MFKSVEALGLLLKGFKTKEWLFKSEGVERLGLFFKSVEYRINIQELRYGRMETQGMMFNGIYYIIDIQEFGDGTIVFSCLDRTGWLLMSI